MRPPHPTQSPVANRFAAWPPRASGPRWHRPRRNVPHARQPGIPATGRHAKKPTAVRPEGRNKVAQARRRMEPTAHRSGLIRRPGPAAARSPPTGRLNEAPTAGPRPQASGRRVPARPSAATEAPGATRHAPAATPAGPTEVPPPRAAHAHGPPPLRKDAWSAATAAPPNQPCVRNGRSRSPTHRAARHAATARPRPATWPKANACPSA